MVALTHGVAQVSEVVVLRGAFQLETLYDAITEITA